MKQICVVGNAVRERPRRTFLAQIGPVLEKGLIKSSRNRRACMTNLMKGRDFLPFLPIMGNVRDGTYVFIYHRYYHHHQPITYYPHCWVAGLSYELHIRRKGHKPPRGTLA
jgi:hypothetical protein